MERSEKDLNRSKRRRPRYTNPPISLLARFPPFQSVRFTSALSEALRISLSIARVIGTDFLCPPCFRTSGRQIVTDRLQQQRFEFKYRINEEKARRIREFV